MRRRKQSQSQSKEPFVLLLFTVLRSPAWRAMSHGARSLFVALRGRYWPKAHNNGKIYLSFREAAEQLGSGQEEICNWFRELQHYGFISMTEQGHLGVEGKGKAPHWLLADLGHREADGTLTPPSNAFLLWDGITKYQRRKRQSRSRSGNAEQGAPEMLSSGAPHFRSTKH